MSEHHPASTHDTSPHAVPSDPGKADGLVIRIPKVNTQTAVLGLVALITAFQTFQIVRIQDKAQAAPVKAATVAPAAANPSAGTSSDAPQAMVGGC